MNIVNLLGILFAVGTLVTAMTWGNPHPMKLVDPHAMIVVIGGTLACVGVGFQLPKAAGMVWVFLKGMFKSRKPDNKKMIGVLMEIAEVYRAGGNIDPIIEKSDDFFLKEAFGALKDEVVTDGQLIKVLSARIDTIYGRYSDEAKLFAACGKYPPAMGLMGAVLGMIQLLGSLGTPGAEKNIGPAMSVALVATLYGIAFANLFVIPIGENLGEQAKATRAKNLIIVEGLRLIMKRTNPLVLAEELNSFLLPSERTTSGSGGAAKKAA